MRKITARQILQALDAEMDSRGHGTKARMIRALGMSKNWWNDRLTAGDLQLSQFLQVLDFLGKDVVRFLRRVARGEHTWGTEVDLPWGDPPEIVRRAWDRFRGGEPEGTLGPSFLETLDRHRYENPREAVDQALWAVDRIRLPLLPRLLGVAASAWRLQLRLEEAYHALCTAIRMAEEQKDRPLVGQLLQRLGYVVAEEGDLEEALELAEQAMMIHMRCGNVAGMGRAMVDQGVWLSRMGRSQEAINLETMALECLPEEERRNRFTAIVVIGLNRRELGDPARAKECVEAALPLVSEQDPWAVVKLNWFHARVSQDLGDLDRAASLMESVVDHLSSMNVGDMAVASCELVQVQLLRNQSTAAYQAAKVLRELLEPFKKNRPISAAIADLLRNGEMGLSLALVEDVRMRVDAEVRSQKLGQIAWES